MSKLLPILVAGTGLNERDILSIVANAPTRYATYEIQKRNGDSRLISQPAREVKKLQRIIQLELLDTMRVHDAATAYRKGRSIRHNVEVHAKNGPILKYDFKDFFPSIRAIDWIRFCQKNSLFSDNIDILISTNILFQKLKGSATLRLAIGAPTSPSLSNILMYEFDCKVCDLIESRFVAYTRYADDLTFSALRAGYLNGVDAALRRAVKETKNPSLVINNDKTVLATKKFKRMITGLIISNDAQVSIGYQRKRLISAAMHRQKKGDLSKKEQAWLAGMLAFINDVEPDFLYRLRIKYGVETIIELKLANKLYKRDIN